MKRGPLPAGFGSLWAAVAVDAIGFGIVVPILPLYAERFDASPAVIGLLLASFSLAQFVAAPRWGRLSDRVGRKPALVVSLLGTTVGAALTAVAPNLVVLFLGRIIDGASGGSLAIAQAATSDIAPASQRTRILGLLGAAFGLGFVVGPALGSAASLVGVRVPFAVAAALAAGNIAFAIRHLRDTRVAPDVHGPAKSRAAVPAWAHLDLRAISFLSTGAFAAFEATFGLLAVRRLGLSAASIGVVFVAAGALVAVANASAAHTVARRLGDVPALRLGLVLDAGGLALLGYAPTTPGVVLAVGVVAIGHGVVAPTLAAVVTARSVDGTRGAALGVQQSAASLARVIGPALAGAMFGIVGPGAAFLLGSALALVAAGITMATGHSARGAIVPEVTAAVDLVA